MKDSPIAKFLLASPSHEGLLLFALSYWLTRKRVCIFLYADLICHHIFLQLVLYILVYCLFISSYCVYIIPSAPEMTVPIFIL